MGNWLSRESRAGSSSGQAGSSGNNAGASSNDAGFSNYTPRPSSDSPGSMSAPRAITQTPQAPTVAYSLSEHTLPPQQSPRAQSLTFHSRPCQCGINCHCTFECSCRELEPGELYTTPCECRPVGELPSTHPASTGRVRNPTPRFLKFPDGSFLPIPGAVTNPPPTPVIRAQVGEPAPRREDPDFAPWQRLPRSQRPWSPLGSGTQQAINHVPSTCQIQAPPNPPGVCSDVFPRLSWCRHPPSACSVCLQELIVRELGRAWDSPTVRCPVCHVQLTAREIVTYGGSGAHELILAVERHGWDVISNSGSQD
ncbi:hypothetical protein M011DRAFT_458981 [Sporormia fimetaria CBS 119925]|uniref:Uncharacterized protein n=1 Tax=Sporormia fimetaria CBS 119925 TaxID=1340428 RepID=A0A6A6VBP7_9PLEO|nr:hypothetical protein M011DRAFT_458981 [Sporormia fimetaria CBS 119925]